MNPPLAHICGRNTRAVFTSLIALGLVAALQSTAGADPAKVNRHASIYDAAHQRTIVFGGYDSDYRGDAWALSLADTVLWNPVTPGATPPPRFAHTATYDPVRHEMVVVAGWLDVSAAGNETWTLSLDNAQAWTQRFPEGALPSARASHSAVYDPSRRRIVVFGGQAVNGTTSAYYNDVWALSLGDTMRWGQLDPGCTSCSGRPGPLLDHSAIYDPVRDRMLVFGGFPPGPNNVWAFAFRDSHWTVVSTTGTAPSTRSGHTAVYDPSGDRMIVFGGQSGGPDLNDTWELSLSTSRWTQMAPAGAAPSVRHYHTAVYDSVNRSMMVFSGTHAGNDETWVLTLGQTSRWSPAKPVLSLSSTDLDLGRVTVGDTVSTSLTVANGGLQGLYLTLSLPSDEFQLTPPPPRRLAWQQQNATTLVFTPRFARPNPDSLIIWSNDPSTPRQRVTLRYLAKDLDFSSGVLNTPAEVPLGESFIVTVTPAPNVRIEGGTLYFRVSGSASPFDSLTLTPLASGFIAAVPAQFVTESGVDYWVRVDNSGFSRTQPVGAPTTYSTQAVAAPTSMTAVPRPTSGVDFLVGREFGIDVDLPVGSRLLSGRVHFRIGGADSETSDSLRVSADFGRPIALIPDSVVGPRGVEYWIEAHTLHSDLRFPAHALDRAIVRTKVQRLVDPAERAARRYSLLSVPLDFANFSGSLDAVLNELGPYNPIQWRAYYYDPNASGNIEFSPAHATEFRPRPGRAFWLISKTPYHLDTAPIDGFSPSTGAPFPIELAPGWNAIADPFDFPVAWAEVVRTPVASPIGPVAFDPSLGKIGGYASTPAARLEPFAGYFLENTSAAPETLWVPAHAATANALVPPTASRLVNAAPPPGVASRAWRLQLDARTDQGEDTANELGVDPGAADAFDALDLRKPPTMPGPWVRIVFNDRDWDALPGLYRRDLRAAGVDGHTWEIETRSSATGEAVDIDLSLLTESRPDLAVKIVDREQGSMTELGNAPGSSASAAGAQGAHVRIASFGPNRPYRLAVIAGSPAYVTRAAADAQIAVTRLDLDAAAPNPFRYATRIRFGLPRAMRVRLEIYGIQGERIATLVDQPLEPGIHSFVWDGRRQQGGRAPSGVYLVRLAAGTDVLSKRLVLTK